MPIIAAALSAMPVLDEGSDIPPPVLDLEGVFGAENLADVNRRYRDGQYVGAVASPVQELFTENGRFNLSPIARFALAQILYDGEEVAFVSPAYTHRREQFVLHLFRKYGVPLYSRYGVMHAAPQAETNHPMIGRQNRVIAGLYGRLAEPPHHNAILLTQQTGCFGARAQANGIGPFESCIVI